MPPRSRASVLPALLCGLFLTACAPSLLVVKPEIAPSLLLPCVDPVLAPENPSDNELATERIRVAKECSPNVTPALRSVAYITDLLVIATHR